jgi:serine/threonine protein kinase
MDTGKPYAMKVIKKKEMKPEQKKRVQGEKKIMQECKSPFIVKLHYTFQTSTKLFYILDYVNGGELGTKMIKSGKLKEDLAKFYTAEILIALKTLHEHGVLYRDITPRNILLDSEGHVKLIDFGLSKLQMDDDSEPPIICGTP